MSLQETKKNRLIMIGASGHGKVCADIARLNGYTDIVFLDNDPDKAACLGFPVLGPDSLTASLEGDLFVSIGNTETREALMNRYRDRRFPTLIHPSAVVAEDAEIGSGSVVMAGAVVNPGARIGRGCIVNTCASVDHDCRIADFCHVAPGAHLSGTVSVGEKTWIGVGTVVSNNIRICADCLIGVGAVVVSDLDTPGTYYGVPAHKA